MLHLSSYHGRIQRVGGRKGVQTPPPLKNHRNIGFLRNTGLDPLKSQRYLASIQCLASTARQQNGPPAKRHFNGVSLVGRWLPIYSGIWILYPRITKKTTKSVIKSGTTLTKLSGSARARILRPQQFAFTTHMTGH